MSIAQYKPLVAILEGTAPIGRRLLLSYDDIEVAAKYMRDQGLTKVSERHFHDAGRPALVQWFVAPKATGSAA